MKPIGSEKLPLNQKISRIMEIANYGVQPKVEYNNNASLTYSITAADGSNYGIIRENSKYIIMKEGRNGYDYLDGMMNNKKYVFSSHGEALKKLNLLMKPINEMYNNGKSLNLIGEQEEEKKAKREEKKYVLKTPKADKETEDLVIDDTPMDDEMDMSMDTDVEMDVEDSSMDLPMDDTEEEETELDIEVPMADENGGRTKKSVEKLTGKLGQKLRELPEEEMTSDFIKYVINSVISAVDLNKLTMDDAEEIAEKFEDEEIDYTEEGEFEVEMTGDEEFDMDVETELEEMENFDFSKPATPELEAQISSIFEESVNRTLNKYFDSPKRKTTKVITENFKNMCHTLEQERGVKNLVRFDRNAKFLNEGRRHNLNFRTRRGDFTVLRSGKIIQL